MHGRMINGDTALCYHLFQVPEAEFVSEIPVHAEQDHRSVKMSGLEHHVPRW